MSNVSASSDPRMVGRYALYKEIASGGMATVHLGRIVGAGGFSRPVAIKRLHAQFARDPSFVAMFLDEARLASRIFHPNVVAPLDVVSTDGELFLVMEYVRGASLSRLLRSAIVEEKLVPPRIVCSILSGVLHGLHAAHEARGDRGEPLEIVHRDVSPQNVLVGVDGVSRVLDFGVAKAAGRMQTTRDGQLKGKLAYMAPEQVKGESVDRRTDIYAASVVLWEALTSKRLFKAENEANALARVLAGKVPPPSTEVPGLPSGIDAVVARGIHLEPSERYATAREMAAELESVLGVATPTEVAEWVEKCAQADLTEQAQHVGEMERSDSHSSWSMKAMRSVPALADVAEPATRVKPIGAPAREPASGVSSVSLAQTTPPFEPTSKRNKIAIAAIAAGAFLIGLVVIVAMSSHTPTTVAAPIATTPPQAATTQVTHTTIDHDRGAARDRNVHRRRSERARAGHQRLGVAESASANATNAASRRRATQTRLQSALYDGREGSRPLQAAMHVGSPIMRRTALAAFLIGITQATSAWADPKKECIDAADQGQSARDDGKYRAARAAFVTCARDVCPRPVAASCTKWAREVEEAMPTIVLSARDASGNDVSSVRVTEGSATLATVLDGKPLEVDPGTHTLHFERQGSEPVDQSVVIKAGEKLRAITVTLHPTEASTKVAETKPEEPKSSGGNGAKTATTVVLGVIAVGGFASAIAMGFASQGDADSAQTIRSTMPANACATNPTTTPCQNLSSAVDAQNRDAAISVAMWVTAGVFAAGAAIAWLAWPKPHTELDHPALSVVVGPAFAGLRGTF